MAELPHTLPWYFGGAVLGAWVVLVALIVRVTRHLLASRAERRRGRRHHGRPGAEVPRPELTP